uniref:Uncharacterized protein n=1 Tax=Amphimedon queenslandica TaxID=400682 RepID=A0A1X7SM56_AMPQE
MKAVLCKTGSTVKHESYCPRHTTLRKTPSKLLSPSNSTLVTPNNLLVPPPLSPLMEQTPLQRVESQFYEYTSHEELSKELKISSQASTLIYNYWKLKRKRCMCIKVLETPAGSFH